MIDSLVNLKNDIKGKLIWKKNYGNEIPQRTIPSACYDKPKKAEKFGIF
jgi:hypothetical protein